MRYRLSLASLVVHIFYQTSSVSAFATPFHAYKRFSSSSAISAAPRVLVPIAHGSEEIETSCITDVLTRFGASVVTASCNPDGSTLCKMSRNLNVVADMNIESASTEIYDLIALPGGIPGASTLRDSSVLTSMLKKQNEGGHLVGAVCAAPAVVLAKHGILPDTATCYPAAHFRATITDPQDSRVVESGNVVTSQGPGTSLDFAIKLGEMLFGKEKAEEIRKELLA